MADPTTSNRLLAIPTRGSDSGTWDLPVNGNSIALDGMFGGVTTISLSSATTLLLSVPSTGSVSAGSGPNQSQNALIVLSGTLTGNCEIKFTLPGFYIVNNKCTVGSSCILLAPSSGTGNIIGAPPGRKCHVFFDGSNMDYVDLPEVGSFMDMAVSATPVWMSPTANSVLSWLVCDGSLYNVSSYPALGNLVGSTFGGNGLTTFGVPDLRARNRIPLDNQGFNGAANRVTAAVSGINGTQWGAAGGDQNVGQHNHTATVIDPGHFHVLNQQAIGNSAGGSNTVQIGGNLLNTNTAVTNISVAVNTGGLGVGANIPPGLVFGMTFIKT
jgi:microcystin-dependent protein